MTYKTYNEDDLIQLSSLQHFAFCERQCALIHIEQVWEENRLTAEGRILHERVHEQDWESWLTAARYYKERLEIILARLMQKR